MKNFKKFVITLATFCLSATAAFANETSTVTITLVNHSNATLVYTGSSEASFSKPPITLNPGATIEIQGTAAYNQDLTGQLNFKDPSGANNLFAVIDYRKIKVGQPLFAFSAANKNFSSTLISKTFNTDPDGRALAYSAATVEINGK